MKYLEIIVEIPLSIYDWGGYVLVLLVCILSALGGIHSSYEQKTSLKKYIIAVILCSLGTMVFIFILIGLVLFMFEYATEEFGFLIGGISMFLVSTLLLALVLCIPKVFFKCKDQKWCKEHPEFCTVQLKHIQHVWNPVKSRGIMPVSIDGVAIKQSHIAITTSQCLYILPGKHSVEFVIFSATKVGGIGRSLPIANEIRSMERTILFIKNRNYICELRGQKSKMTISVKGYVK